MSQSKKEQNIKTKKTSVQNQQTNKSREWLNACEQTLLYFDAVKNEEKVASKRKHQENCHI